MKSADMKNIKLAQILKIRLKNIHFRAAFFAPKSFCHAISSETILVADMFIPADASVIPNIYTDITSENTPTASSPIVFEMYMLKNIWIICNNIVLISNIIVFNIKIFNVFNKFIPSFFKYIKTLQK